VQKTRHVNHPEVQTMKTIVFSDGEGMAFTLEQWAELTVAALIERCPDCPKFTHPTTR
jgi:hypothetical protein